MLPPRPRTLLDLLDERHALTPQQAAFLWDDQPFSFEMLWRGANRFAALLLELGVARGDRVLIRLGNGPEFFDAFYGVRGAGAVVRGHAHGGTVGGPRGYRRGANRFRQRQRARPDRGHLPSRRSR